MAQKRDSVSIIVLIHLFSFVYLSGCKLMSILGPFLLYALQILKSSACIYNIVMWWVSISLSNSQLLPKHAMDCIRFDYFSSFVRICSGNKLGGGS